MTPPQQQQITSTLLTGLKTLDFTRLLPGPVLTHILSQLGSTVTKIESPSRRDSALTSHPALYHSINHSKTLLSLDYENPELKELLVEEYIKKSDVLVEQFRPGAMASWGLGYKEVKAMKPDIIYLSLTGFSQNSSLSPHAGHDINYLSYSGLLSLLKDSSGRPVVPGFQLADVAGGSYMGIIALQSGLIRRFLLERDGVKKEERGCYLDVNMTSSLLPLLTIPISTMNLFGKHGEKLNLLNGNTVANYKLYETKDNKYMAVGALEMKFWRETCRVLNKCEWKGMNQLQLLLPPYGFFPLKELEDLFASKTRLEWEVLFKDENSTCVTPVLEIEELATHPFHLDRQAFSDTTTESGGGVTEEGVRGMVLEALGGKKSINLPFSAKR